MPSPSRTCTLSSLIGSYIDLFITHFLLIGSTFFYFVSKLPVPFCSSFLNDIRDLLFSHTRRRVESLHFSGFVPDKDGIRVESRIGRRVRKRRASGFGKDNFSADFGNNMFLLSGTSPTATSPTVQEIYASTFDMELKIKNLELQLEKSQAANAALYLELEKERSAAASAADEAMAMIYRLQSEKAITEMEARQLQRTMEEKSMYDEEEMNILKEIIVRREMEKHVLEKEVEAYHQITRELKPESEFSLKNDIALMLKATYDSIEEKQNGDGVEKYSIECLEKDIVTLDIYPSNYCESSSIGGKSSITQYELDKGNKDEKQSTIKSGVFDVHVIGDEGNLDVDDNEKAHCKGDGLSAKPSVEDLNSEHSRNSTIDAEKIRLENEVEMLRRRLETIQEGKRTLSSEASELQLIYDIGEKTTESEKKIRQTSLPPLCPKQHWFGELNSFDLLASGVLKEKALLQRVFFATAGA